MKKIKKVLLLIVCISIILMSVKVYRDFRLEESLETLTSNIEETIVGITELSTVKYNYTDIAEYKNNIQFSGLNIPFSTKTFLVKYSGYIKAGYDLDQVDFEIIDRDSILISLGEPKILDNVINEEDVYFYNEKDSAFNKLKFEDLYDLLIKEKVTKAEQVVDKGILNDVRINGEKTLSLFFRDLGFTNIDFK